MAASGRSPPCCCGVAPGVISETCPSNPLIFPSTAPAACFKRALYLGQLAAKSSVRDPNPYPPATTTAISRSTMIIAPTVRGTRILSSSSTAGSRK